MNCAACGRPAPEHHDTYHFAGDKGNRFWLCGAHACYIHVVAEDAIKQLRKAQ